MPLDRAESLESLADRTAAAFAERFGRNPQVVAAAPGRVNLIGEHTDYNGGFVFPMAIDRYTVVAAATADHGEARLASTTMASEARLSTAGEPLGEQPAWAKYAAGVLGVYADEGMPAPAVDAVIDSNVPLGGGLSSSAALEVALATVVESLGEYAVDPKRKALLCQQAEHRAGTPCGIMDQFSSALCEADHLMLLDCRDESAEMRPLTDPAVTVLITNSGVKHELTGGEYAERRQQCEEAAASLGVATLREATLDQLQAAGLGDAHLRRARHVIGEIDRTVRAADAIADGRWDEVGELMYASHASLRDDFEVSCRELDLLVEAAEAVGPAGGVIGSRMTGGGFGGCTVSLVRSDAAESAADRIAEQYHAATQITPVQFVTRPAQGAHLITP